MSNWLDSSNNANCYKSMYVNGFIDVSGGNIQTRNADNHLLIAGDCSFNSNLSLGKDLSIGIENPQYAVDISGTVDLKDNLLMRGDISLNKTLAAQNAGTFENHNYSEQFDDYDNLILKTDQSTAEDTANDEFTVNPSTVWQNYNIKSTNWASGDKFGNNVNNKCLDIDRDYAIIGASEEDSNDVNDPDNNDASSSGAAYIFKRNNNIWTQTAYLKAEYIGAGDLFGESVAIQGDYVIVGAPREQSNSINSPDNNTLSRAGAAYIFKRDSGAETWSQTAYLKPTYTDEQDYFGHSVAINGDYVIIGAKGEKSDSTTDQNNNNLTNAGAAFIFKRDTNAETWSQTAYLKPTVIGPDIFGSSVGIDGDLVVVGAAGEQSNSTTNQNDNSLTSAGAAYIFKRDSGAETWAQKAYLKEPYPKSTNIFGLRVGISGNCVIIGAVMHDGASTTNSNDAQSSTQSGYNSGAAYIFRTTNDGTSWTMVKFLKADPPQKQGYFGRSVAIKGDYATVSEYSATYTDGNTNGTGKVYIYKTSDDGANWTTIGNGLNASAPNEFGQFYSTFGSSLNIDSSGNVISGHSQGVDIVNSGEVNELTAPTAGANNMVLSDDGNRYAYIHGWTGATNPGAGTGGTLKVRSYNNGWSEDTVNDSGSLSVSTGNGSKNLYISGDGNVIVTAQVDSENYDSATDSTNGKIYMWIRNSSTNQWDRTIINIDNTLITGTPKAKNFNNWMTGGFGGVAVNYDGTRIAFSNAGVNDDNSGDASDLFVFGRSGTTLTYLGGVQTTGWGKICRCIFTKTGDKLFVGNYTDNDVKIYTIGSSSISLTKTITTSAHTTAGQLGINETGTKMVYLKDNTNFTVRTTSDNWANSTETTKTYPSSREFNHVGGASSNQKDFYGRWLDMSPNGNTMIVSTITGDNKRGRIGVYDISDLNSITEVKYLDAEAGTYNDDFKVGNNVVCKNTHYGFTANAELTGNWKSYNVFKSYDPTPTTNYYNQEFKGGNLFLNGNLTIDGTLSIGAINATGNTITYDADTMMNKRLYVNNSDLSLDFITNGILHTTTIEYNISEKRFDSDGTLDFGVDSEISADGNYMIIGKSTYDSSKGMCEVYKRTDNTWNLYDQLYNSSSSAQAGQGAGEFVSITHDGEYIVMTGPCHAANLYPIMLIYQRNDTSNQYDLNKTIKHTNYRQKKYGQVQIRKTENGDIFIFYTNKAGSTFSDDGETRMITRIDGTWSHNDSDGTNIGGNATSSDDQWGNGKTLRVNARATRLVAVKWKRTYDGYAGIWDISSTGTITQIGSLITISEEYVSVSINENGNTISIGEYKAGGNNIGMVKVYKYNNDWDMVGSSMNGRYAYNGYFGTAMAINPDGDKIAISSENTSNSSNNMMVIFKNMKVSEAEWNAANDNGNHSGSDEYELSPTTAWKVLYDRGATWDENKYYWYQYSNTFTSTSKYIQLSWAGPSYVLASFGGHVDAYEVNLDTVTTNHGFVVNKVASNINTSGTFFADVSLNHNLVVPGNITIVDGSANSFGAYTTFTNKDATAYFNVGKSASNVFNIVDNNNIGVYMASDGNSMTSTSDERLKTDIESLDDPTEKLMQLKPCTYKWKTQEDDKKHVGFIAQEVEEVFPELVNETTYPDGASYKGVATSDLIPYLIKSIQERQLRINKLENK